MLTSRITHFVDLVPPLMWVFAAMVFIAIVIVVVNLLEKDVRKAEKQVLGRLGQYTATEFEAVGEGAGRATGLAGLLATLRSKLAAREDANKPDAGTAEPVQDELEDQLMKAQINLRPTEWKIISGIVGAVFFIAITVRLNIVAGLLGGIAIGYFGPRFVLTFRARQRLRKIDNQLAAIVPMLSNSLKAGMTFAQAVESVAKQAPDPIRIEFDRVAREIRLGISMDEALARMVGRNASEDLDLLVTAVQIHHRVGGNLAETLDSIADTIRQRVRIKGEMRTLTAQARASGWIIALLPFFLGLFLTLVEPTYFLPMFHELPGLILLGIAGVSVFGGIMIIRKIVDIDV